MEYKKFNNLKEIEKYYVKETNTYMFEENGMYLNVALLFNLGVISNIFAKNILAQDMSCLEIHAVKIDAYDIDAHKIIANNIKALNVNVTDRVVYSGEINIYYSIHCGKILYNKLSNW